MNILILAILLTYVTTLNAEIQTMRNYLSEATTVLRITPEIITGVRITDDINNLNILNVNMLKENDIVIVLNELVLDSNKSLESLNEFKKINSATVIRNNKLIELK